MQWDDWAVINGVSRTIPTKSIVAMSRLDPLREHDDATAVQRLTYLLATNSEKVRKIKLKMRRDR